MTHRLKHFHAIIIIVLSTFNLNILAMDPSGDPDAAQDKTQKHITRAQEKGEDLKKELRVELRSRNRADVAILGDIFLHETRIHRLEHSGNAGSDEERAVYKLIKRTGKVARSELERYGKFTVATRNTFCD